MTEALTIEARTGATRREAFYAALLTATWLPLLVLPALWLAEFPFDGSLLLGLAVFAGGVGHVASTASVYIDRDVREVMRPMPLRFYGVPALALLLTGAALAFGASAPLSDDAVAAMFLVHLLWLHYHYQKQNYGLVAFAAASSSARVPFQLAWALLLPALAGCLAVMPALLDGAFAEVSFWRPLADVMAILSVGAYLAGAAAVAYLVLRHRAVFLQPRVAIFTAGALCFFLPAMLVEDEIYAFWSYALAHGFQYLLMVFLLARGPQRLWLHGIVFVASVAVGGLLLHRLAGNNALFVAGILLTWVHFVLDARLWRMSDAGPRKLIRERFAFLFR
ncbi:MAG: hypothetical protein AAGE01_17785 [Pseudomonadota bacterium]